MTQYWMGPTGFHGGDPLPDDVEATDEEIAINTTRQPDNIAVLLQTRNNQALDDIEAKLKLASSVPDLQSVITDLLAIVKGKP